MKRLQKKPKPQREKKTMSLEDAIKQTIFMLKGIDCRGFDSYDRLVASVNLLTDMLAAIKNTEVNNGQSDR